MPNCYTIRLAPKRRGVGESLPFEIRDMLAAWSFDAQKPVPIRIQVCQVAGKKLAAMGLSAFRAWLRAALFLHPQTPIDIEVYR